MGIKFKYNGQDVVAVTLDSQIVKEVNWDGNTIYEKSYTLSQTIPSSFCYITYSRKSTKSPLGTIGTITPSDPIYNGDVITITATPNPDCEILSLKINGIDFVSGSDYTVSDNVNLVCTATKYYTITWRYLSEYPDTWTTETQTYRHGDIPSKAAPNNVESRYEREVFAAWDDLGEVTSSRTINATYIHQCYVWIWGSQYTSADKTTETWYDRGTIITWTITKANYAFDEYGTSTTTTEIIEGGWQWSPSVTHFRVTEVVGTNCSTTAVPGWYSTSAPPTITWTANSGYTFKQNGTTTLTSTARPGSNRCRAGDFPIPFEAAFQGSIQSSYNQNIYGLSLLVGNGLWQVIINSQYSKTVLDVEMNGYTITLHMEANVSGADWYSMIGTYNPSTNKLTNITFTGEVEGYLPNNGSYELSASTLAVWSCEGDITTLRNTFKRRIRVNNSWTTDSTGEGLVRNTTQTHNHTNSLKLCGTDYGAPVALSLKEDLSSPVTAGRINFWVYNHGSSDVTLRLWYYTSPNYGSNAEIPSVTARAGQWTQCSSAFWNTGTFYNFQISAFYTDGIDLSFEDITFM